MKLLVEGIQSGGGGAEGGAIRADGDAAEGTQTVSIALHVHVHVCTCYCDTVSPAF